MNKSHPEFKRDNTNGETIPPENELAEIPEGKSASKTYEHLHLS